MRTVLCCSHSSALDLCNAFQTSILGRAPRYFWDLRKHVWFWVAIAFIVFLHVFLVLFLPPPAKQWNYVHWNHVQILPFRLCNRVRYHQTCRECDEEKFIAANYGQTGGPLLAQKLEGSFEMWGLRSEPGENSCQVEAS